jgi:hypothetical protein
MKIEYIFSIANIVILLFIFFYQKNRNKLLLERIESQGKLLNETNSIVTTQSSAIQNQHTIVDTAIKYSEAFSLEKIETIIRREIEVEKSEEKKEIVQEYSSEISQISKKIVDLGNEINIRKKLTASLFVCYMNLIKKIPFEEAVKEIDSIKDTETRSLLEFIVRDKDKK